MSNNNNSSHNNNKNVHNNKNNNNNNNNNSNNINEEILQYNQRKLKTVSNDEKIKSMKCTTVSEAVAKFIVEKLISLTISTSYNIQIDKKLSDFCFKKLKQTLDTYTELNFLAYDRDDVPIEKEIIYPKSQNNSHLKINNNINEEFTNNNENNNNKINATQILTNRKSLNESESKNKEIENEKEKEKKEDESFLNYFQKQESIKGFGSGLENIEKIENINNNNLINIESNNIFNSKTNKKNKLFFDAAFVGENDWNIVPQPIPVKVDRNASTMIKYNKDNTNLGRIHEDKNDDKTVIISTSINNNLRSSLILNNNNKSKHKKNISKKSNPDENNTKKKPRVQIEFPSFDIDPKNFVQLNDTEELKLLRIEREQEIEQKKIDYLNKLKKEKERQQIEAEQFNKNKDLQYKNITVDHNGKIVNIKQINLEQLINEFTLGKSESKEIERINGPDLSIKRTSIIVEKNPNNINNNVDSNVNKIGSPKKNLKSKKKKKSDFNKNEDENNITNNASQISIQNILNPNNKNQHDSNYRTSIGFNYINNAKQRQFAAGSNFDIMKMETGVELTEDSKFKSGGKDFFKKFQRYSLENFENQQNRTVTANFYKKKDLIDASGNNTISNELKPIDEYKPLKTDENFHHNNNIYKNINLEPSKQNNLLHLKTKNLKLVLNELDLISEAEEKEYKNFTRTHLGDMYNRNKTEENENNKKNLNDMNKFTKTLMGNSNWGSNMRILQGQNKFEGKRPVKIDSKQIQKEINKNPFNKKLPRSRLPPINNNNNNLNKTEKNFYKRGKKQNNLKLKEDSFINAMEKDDDVETPKNNIPYGTTNNFFKKY